MSAVFKRAMQGYDFYKQCCCKYDFKGAADIAVATCLQQKLQLLKSWIACKFRKKCVGAGNGLQLFLKI